MAGMQLYRVINPSHEKTDVQMDTSKRGLTPRIRRTIELAPVFDLITEYWEVTGCQLLTAIKILTDPHEYSSKFKEAYEKQETLFAARNINKNDKLTFAISEIVEYYNVYQSLGIHMRGGGGESCAIWEYLWERARVESHPHCMSRINSLFTFEKDVDAHKYVKKRLKEEKKNPLAEHSVYDLKIVDVVENRRSEVYDMRWLNEISTCVTYREYQEVVHNYWNGKMKDNPLKEVLFQGIYILRNV